MTDENFPTPDVFDQDMAQQELKNAAAWADRMAHGTVHPSEISNTPTPPASPDEALEMERRPRGELRFDQVKPDFTPCVAMVPESNGEAMCPCDNPSLAGTDLCVWHTPGGALITPAPGTISDQAIEDLQAVFTATNDPESYLRHHGLPVTTPDTSPEPLPAPPEGYTPGPLQRADAAPAGYGDTESEQVHDITSAKIPPLTRDECELRDHPFALVKDVAGLNHCANCLAATGNGDLTRDEAARRMAAAWNMGGDLAPADANTTMPQDRGLTGVVQDLELLTRQLEGYGPLLTDYTSTFAQVMMSFSLAKEDLQALVDTVGKRA